MPNTRSSNVFRLCGLIVQVSRWSAGGVPGQFPVDDGCDPLVVGEPQDFGFESFTVAAGFPRDSVAANSSSCSSDFGQGGAGE